MFEKERELTPEEQKRLEFMKLNPGYKIMGPGRPHKKYRYVSSMEMAETARHN